eukprot:CAMPEP_0184009522 /NCGR_PEP_ID=MMETSP0954-20121128/2656_1 /TAXON_ID=627963 /ORGANISM="Aplanochytrium sp, Strain PBS07" /LENGTH=364 /DNA_ID=CAMNT_0026288913 /DNA_START=340 /DNA_END=1434 /DNA_ORIENTATION=+
MSLGSAAAGIVTSLLADLLRLPNLFYVLSVPAYIVALGYLTLYAFRVVWFPHVSFKELKSSRSISAYSTLGMGFALIFQTMFVYVTMNKNFLWVPVAILLLLALLFIRSVMCDHWPLPEPYWFPSLIGLAILGWTGILVDSHRAYVETMIWLPSIFAFVFIPVVTVLVLRDKHFCNNSTVCILQAPAPIIGVAWFQVGGSSLVTEESNVIIVVFYYFVSVISFGITMFAMSIRRENILKEMGHRWVVFTFPTLGSCNMSLQFWNCLRLDSAVTCNIPIRFNSIASQKVAEDAALAWASLLCSIYLPLVIATIFGITIQLVGYMILGAQEKRPIKREVKNLRPKSKMSSEATRTARDRDTSKSPT